MTATLPAALLVVFWWQRGRLDWRRDVLPAAAVVRRRRGRGAVHRLGGAHSSSARKARSSLSTLLERCLLAGRVIWFYLGKAALAGEPDVFIYPRWTIDAGDLVAIPVSAAACRCWRALLAAAHAGARGPLAGFLFFAGTLFPVLGFLNVYPFVYSYVADHFQYLAEPGNHRACIGRAGARNPAIAFVRAPACFARGGCAACNAGSSDLAQASIYRDSQTIYRATC